MNPSEKALRSLASLDLPNQGRRVACGSLVLIEIALIAKAGVHLNDGRQLGALLDCRLGIQFCGHIGATDQMDFDTG